MMKATGDATSAATSIGFEIQHMNFNFPGGPLIFHDLNIAIPPGQFVTLLGPSGCGKSTLLRLLAQLDTPVAGTVLPSHARYQSGFVFQDATLLPWRTARENVVLPFELLAVTPHHARSNQEPRVQQILARVGLSAAQNLYPHQLSGGMRMRVSIARALVTVPQVLFFDEPFSALDEIQRYLLQVQLRELWQEFGATIIFVTHSAAEAVFLSDRAIVLSPDQPTRVLEDISFQSPAVRTEEFRTTDLFTAQVRRLHQVQNTAAVPPAVGRDL